MRTDTTRVKDGDAESGSVDEVLLVRSTSRGPVSDYPGFETGAAVALSLRAASNYSAVFQCCAARSTSGASPSAMWAAICSAWCRPFSMNQREVARPPQTVPAR